MTVQLHTFSWLAMEGKKKRSIFSLNVWTNLLITSVFWPPETPSYRTPRELWFPATFLTFSIPSVSISFAYRVRMFTLDHFLAMWFSIFLHVPQVYEGKPHLWTIMGVTTTQLRPRNYFLTFLAFAQLMAMAKLPLDRNCFWKKGTAQLSKEKQRRQVCHVACNMQSGHKL